MCIWTNREASELVYINSIRGWFLLIWSEEVDLSRFLSDLRPGPVIRFTILFCRRSSGCISAVELNNWRSTVPWWKRCDLAWDFTTPPSCNAPKRTERHWIVINTKPVIENYARFFFFFHLSWPRLRKTWSQVFGIKYNSVCR